MRRVCAMTLRIWLCVSDIKNTVRVTRKPVTNKMGSRTFAFLRRLFRRYLVN